MRMLFCVRPFWWNFVGGVVHVFLLSISSSWFLIYVCLLLVQMCIYIHVITLVACKHTRTYLQIWVYSIYSKIVYQNGHQSSISVCACHNLLFIYLQYLKSSTASALPTVSIHLSIYLSFFLSIFLSFFLSIFLSFFLSFYLFIFLSFFLSFFLCFFLSFFLSIYLSSYPAINLSIHPCIYLCIYFTLVCAYEYVYLHISVDMQTCRCKHLDGKLIVGNITSVLVDNQWDVVEV